MFLTKEEEKMYDGEYGWAYQVSIRILTRLGELFGAEKLIPIESAHVSGVSYKTIGESPIEFLKAIVDSKGRVKVPTTLNPSLFDTKRLREMEIPEEAVRGQMRIINLYREMGINITLTCTPYYLSRINPDSHVAWAESSAVVYANSILNVWTNREGGPSALASALIGKTPDYGVHRPENREADVIVKVEPDLKREIEYGALGIHVGRILKDELPSFSQLSRCEEDHLKQLCAALASSGMASMFHIRGGGGEAERITVDKHDIEVTIEDLSTSSEDPDLIFIGCPHCSLAEIRRIALMLKGRRVKGDVKLWVCTSRHVMNQALTYVNMIEAAGGRVFCDTCAVVTWIKRLGVETLMTNSAKTAYYAPTLNNVAVLFSTLEECILRACGEL